MAKYDIEGLSNVMSRTEIDPVTGLVRRINEVSLEDIPTYGTPKAATKSPERPFSTQNEEHQPSSAHEEQNGKPEPRYLDFTRDTIAEADRASTERLLRINRKPYQYVPPAPYIDPQYHTYCIWLAHSTSLAEVCLPTNPKELQNLSLKACSVIQERYRKGGFDLGSSADFNYQSRLPPFSPTAHPLHPQWWKNESPFEEVYKVINIARSKIQALEPLLHLNPTSYSYLPREKKPIHSRFAHFRGKFADDLAHEWIPKDDADTLHELGIWMSTEIEAQLVKRGRFGRSPTDPNFNPFDHYMPYHPPLSPQMHPYYPCWLKEHRINAGLLRQYQEMRMLQMRYGQQWFRYVLPTSGRQLCC
jgi:hypothetical protein